MCHPVVNPGNRRQNITEPPILGTAPHIPTSLGKVETIEVTDKIFVQNVASGDPSLLLWPKSLSVHTELLFSMN